MLTALQVAAFLGISKSEVYRLADAGKLKCDRLGIHKGAVRFKQKDVDTYLESCADPSPALRAAVSGRGRGSMVDPVETLAILEKYGPKRKRAKPSQLDP